MLPAGALRLPMAVTRWTTPEFITTWRQFDQIVRNSGRPLLARLDDFPDSVLVTGCQRSGTTLLSRIITLSNGMASYWFGPDDELDGALILCGYVDHRSHERHCFQTTYINTCDEYHGRSRGHRIVWLLRNPWSVVYSMLTNWSDHALDTLFEQCGVAHLSGINALLYKRFGRRSITRLRRACLAYAGKISQLCELRSHLDGRVLVVEYDDLVTRKDVVLPAIYEFIGLEYDVRYAARIQTSSIRKAHGLTDGARTTIRTLCEPAYLRARQFLSRM
jgi:hypothetical protein